MSPQGLVLAFALIYPSVMSWIYFVVLAEPNAQSDLLFQILYGFGKAVQLGLPAAFVLWNAPGKLWPSLPTSRGLGLGLLFGVVVAVGIGGLYLFWLRGQPLVQETPTKIQSVLLKMQVDSPARFVALACAIAVGHALLEEYYWRWFVYFGLRRLLPFWGALLVGSFGFMAHHVIILAVYFPGPEAFARLVVPFSLAVAVGGAFWSWLYEYSGSFYAPWLSHILVDAAIMVVGYDLLARYWVL